ncbi:MAG TPA: erythromycin esterase [Cyanobacteria bacterium UBA8530]|nr:erythromycin esterase [Cyanobacteria bacterium UBA8530]
MPQNTSLLNWLKQQVHPLKGNERDFDPVMDLIGEARIVLLGESSHGTSEFYTTRAALSERLIKEKGFQFVAIEGDWPDALRVDHYVRGAPGNPLDSLRGFRSFPTWMWRNTAVLEFIRWLRNHNENTEKKVGFYGLDLYSLYTSMQEVLRFLKTTDQTAYENAKKRYACFRPFGQDSQLYALQTRYLSASCEEEVAATLVELQRKRRRLAEQSSEEAAFEAELNALAVSDAERYYRHMTMSDVVSWNMRDTHMTAVLERLLERLGPDSKAIVWEHNTHIGDFRATSEGAGGYLNVGELVRQRYGDQVIALGFGTFQGTVTAASAWDGPPEFKRVPPARPDSYEEVFHLSEIPRFFLGLRDLDPQGSPQSWLFDSHEERAIGVVYHPEFESLGNYLNTRLGDRYDGYFFFDETLALEPIEFTESPGTETYPSGI